MLCIYRRRSIIKRASYLVYYCTWCVWRHSHPTTPSLISIRWKWSWTNCRILCLCSLHCQSSSWFIAFKDKIYTWKWMFKWHVSHLTEENAFCMTLLYAFSSFTYSSFVKYNTLDTYVMFDKLWRRFRMRFIHFCVQN